MFFRKDEFDGPPSGSNESARDTLIVRARRQTPAQRIALVLIPLALVLALAWYLLGGRGQEAAAMPPAEVAVAVPLQREIVEYDEFTGRFEPSRSVEIRPPGFGPAPGNPFP